MLVMSMAFHGFALGDGDSHLLRLARGEGVIKESGQQQEALMNYHASLTKSVLGGFDVSLFEDACPDARAALRISRNGAWNARIVIFGRLNEGHRGKVVNELKHLLQATDFREISVYFYEREIKLKTENGWRYEEQSLLESLRWKNIKK